MLGVWTVDSNSTLTRWFSLWTLKITCTAEEPWSNPERLVSALIASVLENLGHFCWNCCLLKYVWIHCWRLRLSLHSPSTEWQPISTSALTSGTKDGWPVTSRPRLNAPCRTGWWERRKRTWYHARPLVCQLRWKGTRWTDTRFITAVAKLQPLHRGPGRDGREAHRG